MENQKGKKVVLGTIMAAIIIVLMVFSNHSKVSDKTITPKHIDRTRPQVQTTETKAEPKVEATAEVKPNMEHITGKNITFFTQDGCVYCKYAMDYITEYYPNLEMEVVDIRSTRGFEKVKAVAKQKGLNSVGTPFIVLGEQDYIVGWSDGNKQKFIDYVNKKD